MDFIVDIHDLRSIISNDICDPLIFLLAPSQVTNSPSPALWISGSAYGVTNCFFLPASKEIILVL